MIILPTKDQIACSKPMLSAKVNKMASQLVLYGKVLDLIAIQKMDIVVACWVRSRVQCRTYRSPHLANTCGTRTSDSTRNCGSSMTLPQFLGLDIASNRVCGAINRGRLYLSPMIPLLEPKPAAALPIALGDPQNLESPSPAVAAAASIQQAEAAAPAKIKAIRFLASMDCSRNPQVEEAFLAALDDPSDAVRTAAVEAIIESNQKCEACNTGCQNCQSCGGCCTQAIFNRLNHLAYSVNENNCWTEPNSKVRRLARIALGKCNTPPPSIAPPVPLEMPSAATIELLYPPQPSK